MSDSSAKTSLGHIRVPDRNRVLAGPWCAQNLADVVKIECHGAGDASDADTSEAACYLAANRGKRSVRLDTANPVRRSATPPCHDLPPPPCQHTDEAG